MRVAIQDDPAIHTNTQDRLLGRSHSGMIACSYPSGGTTGDRSVAMTCRDSSSQRSKRSDTVLVMMSRELRRVLHMTSRVKSIRLHQNFNAFFPLSTIISKRHICLQR